jgi:drug/metabolite transporter (DMT)-like permease
MWCFYFAYERKSELKDFVKDGVNQMKKNTAKLQIIWTLGVGIVLFVCYFISRHDILGSWHGMLQLPIVLLVIGLTVILISTFVYAHKVMACVPVGYILGFALASIFNKDGVDQGGGTTNNGWIIWIVTLMIIIIAGVIWEIAHKHHIGKETFPK